MYIASVLTVAQHLQMCHLFNLRCDNIKNQREKEQVGMTN